MFLVQEHPTKHTEFQLFLSFSDHLLASSSLNGSLLRLKIPEPPILQKGTKRQVQEEVTKAVNRNVIAMSISRDNKYIAITTENKQLVVFDETLQIVKNSILGRVSSKICFSPTNDILVADRTGDVYLYKLVNKESESKLLLGHLSVILDMIITDCGKYIITCDRDEKIRVSHYPNAYNIVTFCLGHTEFVTALKLLKSKNILLSSSGDGTIRMWNYLEGKQVNVINTECLADEKALEKFASEMNNVKVDVTALPITDIQVCERHSNVILAVSLYGLRNLFLYVINSDTLDYLFLETIDVDSLNFSYCLCNRLYIFSQKLSIYAFVDNKSKLISDYKKLEDKLLEYKGVFENDSSDVTLLYKRKYDNVQEYMERKKLRLEMK